MTANDCEAKLYFRENRFPSIKDADPYLQLLASGGYMVEALAKAHYPDGVQLDYGGDRARDFERTMELLTTRENVTLFEATMASGRCHARIDILEKRGNVLRLLEVKAKSFDGAEHAASLANGGKGGFRGKRKPHEILHDWSEKLTDLTYQYILLRRNFPQHDIKPHLVLVDKSKVAGMDNVPSLFELIMSGGRDTDDPGARVATARYTGTTADLAKLDLVTEFDVSDEVMLLVDDVAMKMERRELLLDAPFEMFNATRGSHCNSCEYRDDDASKSGFHVCWDSLAHASPHVLELYNIGKAKHPAGDSLATFMFNAGTVSLLDIDESWLANRDGSVGPLPARQRRQIEYTRKNETFISPELGTKLTNVQYPLHFIDFEALRLALPFHSGMRPYGQVAFQWSCHTVASKDAPAVHREWLNVDYDWPNLAFMESLRALLGDTGTILTWSKFEISVLKEIIRDLEKRFQYDATLDAWVNGLQNRLIDLNRVAELDFYHPAMRGRTSIKIVLDALWKHDAAMRSDFAQYTGMEICADVDPYSALPPIPIRGIDRYVQEGTGAVKAYERMMYGPGAKDAAEKAKWAELLRQYCRLDTLSMVLIYNYWVRVAGDVDHTG